MKLLTAMDGEEGKNLALKENPDLIILDLMLPKLDGLEVCKQLASTKKIYSNFNVNSKRR